jgi:anaerobic selenocysteine-containing dehydrogenase
VLLLNILKGNLGRPGGLLHPGERALRVDAGIGGIAEILRDRSNVVLLHQSNPAFSQSSEIGPILGSSDRATVVCVDSFMSETAALSDFVLPLASPLETLTIAEPLPLGERFLAAALPAAKPGSSCRSFDEWLALLATVLTGAAPALTPDRFASEKLLGKASARLSMDRAIYTLPADSKPLKADIASIVKSLRTLIEEVPKLTNLQAGKYSLTTFQESVQGPAAAPSKWLNEITYSPKIYLHPRGAGRLGIRNGDSITVTGVTGSSINGVALLFEGIHPDAVAIPLHHGHKGYGRIARGEHFADPKDPDMSRIFWGENRGANPADISDRVVTIRKKRG